MSNQVVSSCVQPEEGQAGWQSCMAASLYFTGVLELIRLLEVLIVLVGRTDFLTNDTVHVYGKVIFKVVPELCPIL